MENEIAPLREWLKSEKERPKKDLKVYPVYSSQEIKDFMEGLALLKDNEANLRRIAEILLKLQYLNEKIVEIGLAVDALKKQWLKIHHSDVGILQERVTPLFIL